MSRCRETAGILFKHSCHAAAVAECASCRKPVCATHHRRFPYGALCVSCLRTQLKNPAMRGSYAHLRDDPFFYWYYRPAGWLSDPYGEDDYALFDADDDADFGAGVESHWEGS